MFKSAGKVIPEGLKNLQLGLILLTMLDLLILTYLDRKKNALYLIIFYLIMGLVFYAFKRAGKIWKNRALTRFFNLKIYNIKNLI